MANIAAIFKFLVKLAALVSSAQALVKLAKTAWKLFLHLKKVFRAVPAAKRARKWVTA